MTSMAKKGEKVNRDDEAIKNVGRNIVKYRELKGLSRRRLALICLVEYKSLSNWETGKVDTNITNLTIVARGLGIRTALLFDEPEFEE